MGPTDRRKRRHRQWLIAIAAVAASSLCLTMFIMRRPDAPGPDEAKAPGLSYEPPRTYKPTPGDAGVREQLNTSIAALNFTDVELAEAIDRLRELFGVKIRVNWAALAKEGVAPETAVNVRLKNVTLDKAIRTVLDDVSCVGAERKDQTGLGQVVEDGAVTVSSNTELSGHTDSREYDIGDLIDLLAKSGILLVDTSGRDGELRANPEIITDIDVFSGTVDPASWRDDARYTGSDGLFDTGPDSAWLVTGEALSCSDIVTAIIHAVSTSIDFKSWREFGGVTGEIRQAGRKFVVTQSVANHESITELLEGMRRRLKARGSDQRDSDAAGGELLAGKIDDVDFKNVELRKAIDFIRDKSGVNIHVKWRAVARESIKPDAAVSLRLKNMTAAEALQAICDVASRRGEPGVGPAGLSYVFSDGVVTISTKHDLWWEMSARAYDVREIISICAAAGGVLRNEGEIVDDIKTLVVETIDPGCSRGCYAPGSSICEIGGLLVVTLPTEHHESLGRLLGRVQSKLRRRGPAASDDLMMLPGECGRKKPKGFRVYDVRDIIDHIRKYDTVCAAYGGSDAAGRAARDIISNAVNRDSWGDAGGECSIRIIGGVLGVTQTIENHKAITDLLVNLRKRIKAQKLNARGLGELLGE